MIDKLPPSKALANALAVSAQGRTAAPDHAIAFAQTLKHPMETRDTTDESNTDASERAHRGQAPPESPTEFRVRQHQRSARRPPPRTPPNPAAQGKDAPELPTTKPPVANATVDTLRALHRTALQAPTANIDAAALSRAVRQAVARLTDTSAAARDAASHQRVAVSDSALRSSLARPSGPPPGPPANHAAERFEALLQQFSGRSGDATTFRLIDGTAGTLEVKVALSGQDLHVQVRAEDPAMSNAVAASLDDLRRQLQAANIIAPEGDIYVSQEPPHDRDIDDEHRQPSDPDTGDLDRAQDRPERRDGQQ